MESKIQEFYKSRNVFITGGTGFVGKLLIEKLLRSTEVATIYVLIREKKGRNALSRIDELFDDVIFDRLKKECPKYKHRVEAIPGDCSVTGLGLSITDRQKLMKEIHVVFHVAATVKFDENLKLAYMINVNAAKDVLELARQMRQLTAIMHISTAYSNCHLEEVEEKFYDCPYSYLDVEKVLEKMNRNEVDQLTPRIISPWPNTYTFTKALSESMVKETGTGLPVGIFRPSIVISTYKEPVEGWIDNLYGPTGVCAGTMAGLVRGMLCSPDCIADLVPADTCIAGLIASASDVASKKCERTAENIPIYNYVSSADNPLTWNEFAQLNLLHGSKYPVVTSLWATSLIVTSNVKLYYIIVLFLHIFPGLLMDIGLVISGKKPRMLALYKKIHKATNILFYFSTRDWKFSNKNAKNLWLQMNPADRELFPCSITTVHWTIYFRRYTKGIREYLLKDPESTLETAKKRARWLSLIHQATKIGLIFIAFSALSSMFSKMYSLVF